MGQLAWRELYSWEEVAQQNTGEVGEVVKEVVKEVPERLVESGGEGLEKGKREGRGRRWRG